MGAPMFAPSPAASSGPLPPFGSDVTPRQVVPASGPPSAAPAAPAAPTPAASPAVAPLPPGVAGSGVGGAAAGAYAGMKSNNPDPLLNAASQLVYQLMHASRVYGCVDWCVGIFKTGYGIDTVVVSNEGAGYIPPGVFLPRSARTLFSDTGLTAGVSRALVRLGESRADDARVCGADRRPRSEFAVVWVGGVDRSWRFGAAGPRRRCGVL